MSPDWRDELLRLLARPKRSDDTYTWATDSAIKRLLMAHALELVTTHKRVLP